MLLTRRRMMTAGASLAAAGWMGKSEAAAQERRIVRFTPEFDLSVFDPIANTGLTTLQHAYLIYDTLFAMDASRTPRPQMVETFGVSDDQLTHSFKLRAGLKFHDGSKVRSADCIASIRRWGARDVTGRKLMQQVAGIDPDGEDGFRIVLKAPFPLLLTAFAKMTSNVCFIMREKEALSDPNKPITETIGSGPFRFNRDEFIPGAKVVYDKFDDYVPRQEPADGYAGGKVVNIDRVEWVIIPDAATQVNALIAGEIDVLSSPPLELLPQLAGQSGTELQYIDNQGWLAYLRTNALYPPFNDVRARRALAHLVNQADYMSAVAGKSDNWSECWQFLMCDSRMGAAGGMEAYGSAQPDLARQLLEEAGYRGEPVVVLHPTDNPILGGIAELTIDLLRGIKVNVEPRAGDLATVFAMRSRRQPPAEGGWNIFATRSLGLEVDNPVTSFPLASPCSTDAEGNRAGWFGWHCDQPIEDLRQSWMDAPTEAKRIEIAKALQLRAAETLPFIPVGRLRLPIGRRSAIAGLIDMPIVVFWNMTKQG